MPFVRSPPSLIPYLYVVVEDPIKYEALGKEGSFVDSSKGWIDTEKPPLLLLPSTPPNGVWRRLFSIFSAVKVILKETASDIGHTAAVVVLSTLPGELQQPTSYHLASGWPHQVWDVCCRLSLYFVL